MKKIHTWLVCLGLFGVALNTSVCSAENITASHLEEAKNIIFIVPDGMGLADVTATRIYKNGPDGKRLAFEQMPVIGYQSTHSANSTVTDSAAAASAWATGEKFNNGEISCHSKNHICIDTPKTLLELAKQKGKATGLVATSTITHATPAAFGAHTHSRKCETEIGRQYIEVTGVDVLLGGGIGSNRSGNNCEQYPSKYMTSKDIIASAVTKGYVFVDTENELHAAASSGAAKVLGLFSPGGKTPETYRVTGGEYPTGEPTLPEMADAAIDILEEDKDGFFLVIEASQIDWKKHDNDLVGMLGEMLAFDETVETVFKWVHEEGDRKKTTLVIVVADHEAGGFAITGPRDQLSKIGNLVEGGWSTGNHSAVDTLIWSQGPGSRMLGRSLDNTDLNKFIKKSMK